MRASGRSERALRHFDTSPDLDTSSGTRIAWLESRAAALERQIEFRIQQVRELQHQLGDIDAIAGDDRTLLIAKAKRYDELMQTRTMRFLRRPRGAYAWFRRFNRDRRD